MIHPINSDFINTTANFPNGEERKVEFIGTPTFETATTTYACIGNESFPVFGIHTENEMTPLLFPAVVF